MQYTVKLDGEKLVCIEVQRAPGIAAVATKFSMDLVCAGDSLSEHAVQCADVLSLVKLVPRAGDAPSATEFATTELNRWIAELRSLAFGPNDEFVFEAVYRYGTEYLTLTIDPIYE